MRSSCEGWVAYCSGNEETSEEVPEAEEESHDNGSKLGTGRQCNEHHSIQCEVDETGKHEVVEP